MGFTGRLHVIRADIVTLDVDAIINAANASLLGGGGVDGAIHRAAGPALLEYCRGLGGCPTGEARITPGFDLPARFVIHAVGPVWRGGGHGEAELLAGAYRAAYRLAAEHGLTRIALPAVSAGAYGYPRDQAAAVSAHEAGTALRARPELRVWLVAYDEEMRAALARAVDGLVE